MKKLPPISRRKFMDISAKGTAALGLSQTIGLPILSSCSDQTKTVFGACYHDCPDACSWKVTMQGDEVVEFGPNPTNAFTANALCDKMNKFPDEVTYHPDRLLTPLKRIGEKGEGVFEPISWDQAIKEVTDKLKSIVSQYGGEAVLPYKYAGTEGLVQRNAMGSRFFAKLESSLLDGTICGNTSDAGVNMAKGGSVGMLPEDIIHSRYIMLWGTNTKNSNQHLWRLVKQAMAQGAKLVVIDPFQSATALEADWHIRPVPGTDSALALSMIQVILEEGLEDREYISNYTVGIDKLQAHVQNYKPEMVANITGLDPQEIRLLAREYAKGSPSVIRVLIGMEHHSNGGNAFWAVSMLPTITGAWRQLGGGLLHMTYALYGDALNWSSVDMGGIRTKSARSINMVEIGKHLNDPELSPKIHAMFVYNSNPAVIAPNQNEVIKGLKREDLFTVVLEHFMTDTARYSDYILPATTQLEHWDLLSSWGSTYLNLNQPAILPRGESKPNNEIFRLLAKGMGFKDDFFNETDLEILKKTLQSDHPYMQGINFDALMKTGTARLNLPEPWLPHAEGDFVLDPSQIKDPSEAGKAKFYILTEESEELMPGYVPVDHGTNRQLYPLQLLAIKSAKTFLNTSHANVRRLRDKEGSLQLEINEQDALDRGLSSGDRVRIYNQYGELILPVRISGKVRQGVVSMPQGHWSSLTEGGSSANALTSDSLADYGRGGAWLDTIVEVVKA